MVGMIWNRHDETQAVIAIRRRWRMRRHEGAYRPQTMGDRRPARTDVSQPRGSRESLAASRRSTGNQRCSKLHQTPMSVAGRADSFEMVVRPDRDGERRVGKKGVRRGG